MTRQFAVAGSGDEHGDYGQPVALRCTVCGKWSPPFGEGGDHGDSAMLSDLTGWAGSHECERRMRTNDELRRVRQSEMTDAEYIAHMEWNYRRSDYPYSLLEFMGMTPDEYAGWIMNGTVPERVMRVARRRP